MIGYWINISIMSLRLGEVTDGTFCTMGFGEPLYTWIFWIHFDCAAYYGHMGNPQIQLAALGSI
jgi:hypothetical protein